ncbi:MULTISPECIES: potassium-transporting ATPase subunit KdpB [Caldanaerobacter]|uniref:Potassium-transporting ATPase ATP-binding subunit n=3 Tax=Caldanaerobacter subterraneus TaxID=911092 RepID=KDPB_CALS4|nr:MULTISPECIES: potassium-transporting ATPase subunit KdpB [Caldanaerobacter]Q8R8I6.1 RecName: Full=Potassium-transporting ATPase ATP-binding subunit; AltName: Full=ATP phosphohydrolase [potassium-transporting] B chain; AltName: Full=Potassium-binding and translocating subunit B; AltName: Full=Potassium-translocating ATPase B chain [Caldanaerobacter subterraneus subsp. tengcongensis MB4]AAM25189.1 High-affinity K+ transport system, ATPase chain B [Caldanaerobacter subterraneus subsp. tengcongens
MKRKREIKTWSREIVVGAIKNSFIKLNPLYMYKNPVMFVVEVGTFITLLATIFPTYFGSTPDEVGYNALVTFILFVTVLFANFAESLAEGRGKAQAETLRKTKKETMAKLVQSDGSIKIVKSSELKKGDIVICEAGDIIPADGEIIEGLAAIDESAITGESAPVIKEAGGDFSSVTGGTKVISDRIKIRVTVDEGESFLDRMIKLVEGAKRQKSPNEIALTTVLVSLTIIFIVVVMTLYPMAKFVHVRISAATMIALLVCLIPTTIGGLLSAIGIAGMDRVTRFNVIAMSGKAVEAAGDIDTILLDKTGTITFGNRLAADFIPVGGHSKEEVTYYALISSLKDLTPEGRSIVDLARKMGAKAPDDILEGAEVVEFSAETRMSGLNLKDGTIVRKGSYDKVKEYIGEKGGSIPDDLDKEVEKISLLGGTPLVVVKDNEVLGVIYLKDTIKPGMKERFKQLRAMGIKTIMITGDNPLTAKTIAEEAGVDEFIAESKPEDKINVIKREQAQGRLVAMTGDGTNDAPALAQADVGLAMNSGTMAAKEAANMVDLDSDPTKIIEVVGIGKQLLMTRGALTTFSIANDVAKYFAILPAIISETLPAIKVLDVMKLSSPTNAILSALIYNAIIIPILIPIAMRGVKYRPMSANALLMRNLLIYGLGGLIAPFVGIKLIDMIISSIFGM